MQTSVTKMISFPLLLDFLLIFAPFSFAWPKRPGTCNAPIPMDGSKHILPGFIGATDLFNFGLKLQIGGVTLEPVTPFVVAANTDYDIQIIATSNIFRGFLIRLDGGESNATNWLDTDDPMAQVFELCHFDQNAGLAHNSNDDKVSTSGTLHIDQIQDDLDLRVTVVIRNGVSQEGSWWYTSKYTLHSRTEGSPTTSPGSSPLTLPPTNDPATSSGIVTGNTMTSMTIVLLGVLAIRFLSTA